MAISDRLARLADITERAGRIAQKIRREGIDRELKSDGSIVTEADRETERFLRSELPALAPGATIWGEEFGFEPEGENGLWVVDPVDGTSNFGFGSPLWGVSVALVRGDDAVIGAVALPELGEIFLAEAGEGAWLNGSALAPIGAGPIQPFELVSYSDSFLRRHPAADLPGRMRISGAFVLDGTFMAAQRLRALVGFGEKLYDVAACVLMARELGAEVRYLDGSPFSLDALKRPETIGKPWGMLPKDSGLTIP